MKIKLESIDDIKTFVSIASKEPYSIDVKSGRYVVEAASLMGMFSLDLSHPVELFCEEGFSNKFITAIEKYICTE